MIQRETNYSKVSTTLVCKMEGGLFVGRVSKVILSGRGRISTKVMPAPFSPASNERTQMYYFNHILVQTILSQIFFIDPRIHNINIEAAIPHIPEDSSTGHDSLEYDNFGSGRIISLCRDGG